MKSNTNEKKDIEVLISKIAKDVLYITTLETRKSDSLDFHNVSVWQVKEALLEAYQAGVDSVKK